jgi:hypothetical protein
VRTCAYGFGKIKFRSANGFMLGSGESDKESGGVEWIGGGGCGRMGMWRVKGAKVAWWKIFFRMFFLLIPQRRNVWCRLGED